MFINDRTAGCGGTSGGPCWSGVPPSVQGGTRKRQKLSPWTNPHTCTGGKLGVRRLNCSTKKTGITLKAD
jgi:hypothetical protein